MCHQRRVDTPLSALASRLACIMAAPAQILAQRRPHRQCSRRPPCVLQLSAASRKLSLLTSLRAFVVGIFCAAPKVLPGILAAYRGANGHERNSLAFLLLGGVLREPQQLSGLDYLVHSAGAGIQELFAEPHRRIGDDRCCLKACRVAAPSTWVQFFHGFDLSSW